MQTDLADWIKDTPEGREADRILRKCVHCGFCTATCPTYQLLGDELDGPRGRIYLIKQVVEGHAPTERTRLHLDRCLTCRSCETTCPSGVEYGRLVDIGRGLVEGAAPRSIGDNAKRRAIATLFPQSDLFGLGVKAAQALRPLVPAALRDKLPGQIPNAGPWPAPRHARRMVTLAGCVQPALDPAINAAAARVLDRLGISLVEVEGAGVLRRPSLPPQLPGGRTRGHAPRRRCMGAGGRGGRGGRRDHRERLRLDGQGVRPPP